jgi:hypothetical protein
MLIWIEKIYQIVHLFFFKFCLTTNSWLDISTAQNCRQRATVLSFGAGPRVCIAQRLNMLQLKATLIPFLRRFYINYDRAMSSPTLVGIAEQGNIHINGH